MKSFKVALVSFISLMSVSSFAAEAMMPYIIIVKNEFDFAECADDIEMIKGVTVTERIDIISTVAAEMSDRALSKVQKMDCVGSVEEDQQAYPLPAIGGSK
ncbi:hypothetical protein K2X30_00095 [bacterium]|jgi:hypothetical protein|nr:hypothetical protein [bacterium]